MSSAVPVDTCHTRYHTTSNPPPGLAAVFEGLRKATRRRAVLRKHEVRSIAAGTEREYKTRGRADDLYRFLRNATVLLKEMPTGMLYFDAERADQVLFACANHTEAPWAESKEEERIAKIRAERVPPSTGLESVSEFGAESMASIDDDDDENDVAAEDLPRDPEAKPLPLVAAPVSPRGALYLTPVEHDVWVALNAGTEDGEFAVPRSPESCLAKFRTSLVRCTREEFLRAVRRFESSPLVTVVKENEQSIRYRWTPTDYHLIEIERRTPLRISADIIQRVTTHVGTNIGITSPRTRTEVEALLNAPIEWEQPNAASFRPLNLAHLRWLYLGDERSDGLRWKLPLFVTVDPGQESRLTPAVPPFLPVRFYAPSQTPRIVAHVYQVVDPESLKETHVLSPTTERERNTTSADAPIFSPDGEIEDGLASRETLTFASSETLQQHAKLFAAIRDFPIRELAESVGEEIARRNKEEQERQRRQAEREELDMRLQIARVQAQEAQALLAKLEERYLSLDE